jgi:hypothetical protein
MRFTIPRERLAIAVIMSLATPLAGAQRDADSALDRSPVRCVSGGRVQRMEPIDDRTILFYMRGGAIYRNTLRQECRDLQYSKLLELDSTGRAIGTDL